MKKIFLMLFVALFVSFVYGQTKTEVKATDLNKEITDNVAKGFAGYQIDKSFKSDAGGVITFEVMISKAKERIILVYDKDGKFVKKIEPAKKMEPVKKDIIKKDVAKVVYTCTMHPDVQADKPGKCPKCGMDLVKKEVENKKIEIKK